MERSPIRDIEIKYVLKNALTDDVNSCEIYMKGIDYSYYYEGYTTFKSDDLQYTLKDSAKTGSTSDGGASSLFHTVFLIQAH